MSVKSKILKLGYKSVVKPIMFLQDAESVHNRITYLGEELGKHFLTQKLCSSVFEYKHSSLTQNVVGLNFNNPVGLSAGFDYNGHLAEIVPSVGFGFNTVGTVTAHAYAGNSGLRLGRLPKSKSLLVNKGFKSDGAEVVRNRLRQKNLTNKMVGLSVGSSNVTEVDTIGKSVEDYAKTFSLFRDEAYIKYFELNISCPNTKLAEGFFNVNNFKLLLSEIKKINIQKPVFVKMPNEINFEQVDEIVKMAINFGVNGFILSNLVKNRNNPLFDQSEVNKFKNNLGNFSGRPTYDGSNKLIEYVYRKYGLDTIIIGCGGIFSALDAYTKTKLGASLVQMITGVIYEGPEIIGEINEGLAHLLKNDGYQNISEAIGSAVKV